MRDLGDRLVVITAILIFALVLFLAVLGQVSGASGSPAQLMPTPTPVVDGKTAWTMTMIVKFRPGSERPYVLEVPAWDSAYGYASADDMETGLIYVFKVQEGGPQLDKQFGALEAPLLWEQVAALSVNQRLTLERLDEHERNHALMSVYPSDNMRAFYEQLQQLTRRVERLDWLSTLKPVD
jgi:hypothetical protein